MTKEIDRSKIIVLGSTGSVGTQALDTAEKHGIVVEGISGYNNIKLLEEQIHRYRPKFCAVKDDNAYKELKIRCADTGTKICAGESAIEQMLSESDSDIAVNAITGKAGLLPTLDVIKYKRRLALANKESLVIAGELVTRLAKESGTEIIPVDSEHSAIFQCIGQEKTENISRIILTASGGPFFGMSREETEKITPEMALAHPTWRMGKKITIDSATLMNKGFEVIEAVWLFGVSIDMVNVVVHRESIIHSMVEYIDNAVLAQLAKPDMRLCIQYAITYPDRCKAIIKPLNFADNLNLSFSAPDDKAFPCLELAKQSFIRGGVSTAALNAANEIAVSAFLSEKIKFNEIPDIVSEVVSNTPGLQKPTLEDYLSADETARNDSKRIIGGRV